jgi:hypothetical protein
VEFLESLAFEKSKSGFLFFDFKRLSQPAVDWLVQNSEGRLTFFSFPREEYLGSMPLGH